MPESGLLVICGALITLILQAILGLDELGGYGLDDIEMEESYLEILIAPIILHASYSLYHPHFFGQIGTILIMAFIATTLNVLLITPITLFIFEKTKLGHGFSLFDSVTYASLISAVVSCLMSQIFVNLDFYLPPRIPWLSWQCSMM